MQKYLLSICIPSYNRVTELKRLLDSIDVNDTFEKRLEIIVSEDMSPQREKIAKVVNDFKINAPYQVKYIENEENYGYDKNLRSVANKASGEWVIFMGDDDLFVPGALNKYMNFLRSEEETGYVLRRYRKKYRNGILEDFRYAQNDVYFKPGEKTIIELFRRSLFISGFTFRKKWFTDYCCADYDGTLLFQLYILACVCINHKACYSDILLTEAIEGGIPYFGKARAEQSLYDSGYNSVRNSLNFMSQVKILAQDIDKKLDINITDAIMLSYSKYSYGFLHEHRDDNIQTFRLYAKELKKLGFARTYHFYLYYYALLILGKKNCQKIIIGIKRRIGNTPRF